LVTLRVKIRTFKSEVATSRKEGKNPHPENRRDATPKFFQGLA
jgi:hypothetical protein